MCQATRQSGSRKKGSSGAKGSRGKGTVQQQLGRRAAWDNGQGASTWCGRRAGKQGLPAVRLGCWGSRGQAGCSGGAVGRECGQAGRRAGQQGGARREGQGRQNWSGWRGFVERYRCCRAALAALQACQGAVERRRFSAATAAEQAPTMPPISPRPGVGAAAAAGAAGAAAGCCSTGDQGHGRAGELGWGVRHVGARAGTRAGGHTRAQQPAVATEQRPQSCCRPRLSTVIAQPRARQARLPAHLAGLLGGALLGGRRLLGGGGLLDRGRRRLVLLARAGRLLAGAATGRLLGAGRLHGVARGRRPSRDGRALRRWAEGRCRTQARGRRPGQQSACQCLAADDDSRACYGAAPRDKGHGVPSA